jgi:predicted RNase H-like HicB family nuclease/predicted phosphodiesterase
MPDGRDLVFVEEEGKWSAHDPTVPGAYGLGDSKEAAEADLRMALELLADYEASEQKATPAPQPEPRRGVADRVTKIGIVADIHGDVASLDGALARIREMGCTMVLCPGDFLDGIEPFSEEVVQRVKAENVVTILGNHERWALERRRRQPDPRKFAPPIAEMPDQFRGDAKLSREAVAYLRTLPSRWGGTIEGVRLAMHHARPGSDMEGITVETTPPALRRRLLAQAGAEVLHTCPRERTAASRSTRAAFSSIEERGGLAVAAQECSSADLLTRLEQ